MRTARSRRPRGVVDTSVLVAGISGLRTDLVSPSNASAILLRDWQKRGAFTWLVSEEILDEYKVVLARLNVRRETIGLLINLLREEAELIAPKSNRAISPDPADDPFCACAQDGAAHFLVTLNPRDFPQTALSAKVVSPHAALAIIGNPVRQPNSGTRLKRKT